MRIIVGLGNPGTKYDKTRHNVGFMAVDVLAERLGAKWETKKKFEAEIAEAGDIMLVKPGCFMNLSGKPAASILSYYQLLPKKLGFLAVKNADLSQILTVIHDDLDIELGKYKIAVASRSAGHRGVQSIIDMAKTKKFERIRIGIKTSALAQIPAEKFVLQKFGEEEMDIIKRIIDEIVLKY